MGVVAAMMLLAGCGTGAGAATTTNTKTDSTDAALKYTHCMRDHGINVSDPQISSNGHSGTIRIQGNASGVNPDSAQFQRAQSACKQYLPNGGQLSPQQQAEAQQKALAFARCMRAHGVDIPDPQPSTGGSVFKGSGNINPDDPHFQQAQQACQSYLGVPNGGPSTKTSGGNG